MRVPVANDFIEDDAHPEMRVRASADQSQPWLTDPRYGGMSPAAAEASWRAAPRQIKKREQNQLPRPRDAEEPAPIKLEWVNTSRWDHEPCPEREWAVKDRVPLRQVTLFSGEGAIGKSIVELMLAVAHVRAKDWLGSLPEPGGALYFGCEDDEAELRIRLSAIIAHYGTSFEELHANGFRFTSLAGQDAVLGAPDRSGIIRPTPLYDQLYEQAGDLKPKHIGIDTSADVFAGNEIDRTQVRQFIGLLRRLAMVSNGSVVLLSHPQLNRHQQRLWHQRVDCVAQ
jgi:RecA-family ATPase